MTILQRSPLHLLRRRHANSATSSRLTIGIRREDPLRIWERRCPLTPDLVHELVHKDGVDILVEDCDRRVWNSDDILKVRVSSLYVSSPHVFLGRRDDQPNARSSTHHPRYQGDASARSTQ